MRRIAISPRAYRVVTLVAAVALAVIILTGAAVRLTGSGLGCPTWPECAPGQLVAKAQADSHQQIEFWNRAFTGVVSVAVMLAVLGSLVRRPRRRELTWLSVGLVAGVMAQAVFRGTDDPNDITVLHDFASDAKAKAFANSAELKSAMQNSGVTGSPQVWFTARAAK